MRKIIDCTNEATNDRIKYLVKVDGKEADEIIAYNKILNHLASQFGDINDADRFWTFRKILGHKGGSSYFVPLLEGECLAQLNTGAIVVPLIARGLVHL